MSQITKDVLHSHASEKGREAGRVQTVDSSYESSSVLPLHCSTLFPYCRHVTHDDPGLRGLNFTSTRTRTLLSPCPVPQPQHDALCLVFFFVYPHHVVKS